MATLARSLLRCVKSTPSVLQGSNFMCFKKIETMINMYNYVFKLKSIKRSIEVTKINHNQLSIQPYFLYLMFILFSLKQKTL